MIKLISRLIKQIIVFTSKILISSIKNQYDNQKYAFIEYNPLKIPGEFT